MALNPLMKVIVIDDVITMRKMIITMMKNFGFKNIEQADNGVTAWEMIDQAYKSGEPYEFIVSDWEMPKMNGLELLKKVRASDKVSTTPFLMVTVKTAQTDILNALKAEVSGFVVKPFNPDTLKQKIAQIFN